MKGQQEPRTCKKISYRFYCEELSVVRHKSKYICESAVYFSLGSGVIKENAILLITFNKTDGTPTVLDGGYEINLANWPDDKHIICNINNDISIKIPSHPYVLVNRSVLCNCGIELENNFLLESLAAYHNAESKLIIYFTVNTAFVNYLDNLPDSLKFPILLNRTTYEQTLPISLKSFVFNSDLLKAPVTLKRLYSPVLESKGIF